MAVYTIQDEIARKQANNIPLNNGKVATTTVVKDPVATTQKITPTTTATSITTGTTQKKDNPLAVPGVGSNVANFNPNNTVASQIAKLGQDWYAAAGNAPLQAQLHDQANALRGGTGSFNSQTGVHTLAAPGVEGEFTGSEYQSDIDAEIRAFQEKQEAAKLAAQFGIDTNNAGLASGLAGFNSAEAVAGDSAQQLQNRRGGFYSGGLDYQMGGIQRGYAQARSDLTRDVNSRNQQILDQYGTQANSIADQISGLQSAAPGIIRDKILDYQLQTADVTGKFNGQDTRAVVEDNRDYDRGVLETDRAYNAGQDATKLNSAYEQADITGVVGSYLGSLYGLPANTPTRTAMDSNRNYELDKRQANASIANMNADNARANEAASKEKAPKYDYTTDPSFAEDVQFALNDSSALSQLKANATMFTQKYGKDGFDALIEYATPKKKTTTDLFSQLFSQQGVQYGRI